MKRNRNAVKHPLPPDPNASFEFELARRLAGHHLHDAARILYDCLYLVPTLEKRTAFTEIIGALQTLERRLRDLEVAFTKEVAK